MNKILIISLFIITISLIQAPASFAWNVNTHYEIAENNYNAMPDDVRQKLSLEDMLDGADDPDVKFFDFSNHSYPNSLKRADYWLNEGKKHYGMGDYKYASYCFGVASHYVSDTFSAPHCIKNGKGLNHVIYELQGSLISPKVPIYAANEYSGGNMPAYLNSNMYNGSLNGQNSWKNWINNRDSSYVQNDLNKASGASYNAINGVIIESNFS